MISATEKLIAKKQDIKKGLMQELLTGKRRLPGFTKEWCRLTLKEIGLFKKARGISRSNAQSGSIRAIRYGELYTLHDRYVVTYGSHISTQVASEATLVKRGDILFAASGETKEEIGKCAAIIDQGEIFAGGDIIVFTPSVATDPFFLGTVLNTENVIKQKAEKGQGDAVVHIHIPELEKISISIPSFEEQVAIGKIIFEFDSECLVLYKKLKKLHDIKQGMMSELLTGRIRLKEVKETGELNE